MADLTDSEILDMYVWGLSVKAISGVLGRSIRRPLRIVTNAGILRPFAKGGPLHSQWKGGRLEAGQGYWRVWVAPSDPMASMRDHQGYVKEHRLVVARKLGRPLLPSETVHHINGDKGHNADDNLQLRQGKHGKHEAMICHDCGSHNVGPTNLK